MFFIYSPLKDRGIEKGNPVSRAQSEPLEKLKLKIHGILNSLSIIFTYLLTYYITHLYILYTGYTNSVEELFIFFSRPQKSIYLLRTNYLN